MRHREFDQRLAAGAGRLVVLREAAVAAQPGERPLDNPAARGRTSKPWASRRGTTSSRTGYAGRQARTQAASRA